MKLCPDLSAAWLDRTAFAAFNGTNPWIGGIKCGVQRGMNIDGFPALIESGKMILKKQLLVLAKP